MFFLNFRSGNADTPTTLRRSSRTKVPSSPVPNDRTTRSQINPDIIAKQKYEITNLLDYLTAF